MTQSDEPILWPIDLAGVDDPIPVPSGQAVLLQDVVQDAPGPQGLTVRFRFVAPAIARAGGTVAPEDAFVDMEYLCRTYAMPRLSNTGPVPAQVVISLSDMAVPFGEPVPEATQFFEAYRIEDGTCIWEAF